MSSKTMNRVLTGAGIALTSAAFVLMPASAGAAPATQACGTRTVRSASLVASQKYIQGVIELRYDSCSRTVWARVSTFYSKTCVPFQDYCGSATVHRNSDGKEITCFIPAGATSCYTAALSDANVTSYAEGTFENGNLGYWGKTSSY